MLSTPDVIERRKRFYAKFGIQFGSDESGPVVLPMTVSDLRFGPASEKLTKYDLADGLFSLAKCNLTPADEASRLRTDVGSLREWQNEFFKRPLRKGIGFWATINKSFLVVGAFIILVAGIFLARSN